MLLCLVLSGPQSPCERTDLRMAIVADHLGLSWTGKSLQKTGEGRHLEDKAQIYATFVYTFVVKICCLAIFLFSFHN